METANISGKEAGFTLVELLVVLALAGIITAGLVNFMISQSRNYNLQEDMQEMEQNARVALEFFARKIRMADKIEIFDPDENVCGNKKKLITFTFIIDDTAIPPTTKEETYYFKFRGSDAMDDADAERIGQSTANVACFLQDLDNDKKLDFPVFREDEPGVITITIEARTRRRDPNYSKNNGYRRIILSRKVVARSVS